MQNIARKITGYIDYLRSLGLSISIHFDAESINKLPYNIWRKLLPYNSHNNPYCIAVKSCSAEACIAHQHAVIESMCDECMVSVCHAGVGEYLFRIPIPDRTIGYVAVSGYKSDSGLIRSCEQYRSSLSQDPIPTELCDTLVPPLVIMLSNLFLECQQYEPSEQNIISQYLAENHTTVDFDTFCRHFSRSRSYMSHMFKKTFGVTFSEYCNNLRLEDAERLLLSTDLSVTEIALGCGFGDVSYFIRLFRERRKVPPLRFRKRMLKG